VGQCSLSVGKEKALVRRGCADWVKRHEKRDISSYATGDKSKFHPLSGGVGEGDKKPERNNSGGGC